MSEAKVDFGGRTVLLLNYNITRCTNVSGLLYPLY